jgi:hypothetical protein
VETVGWDMFVSFSKDTPMVVFSGNEWVDVHNQSDDTLMYDIIAYLKATGKSRLARNLWYYATDECIIEG